MVPPATPSASHERVSFGPLPGWVTEREVDYSYQPPVETPAAILLEDHQHHATRHESYHRTVQRLDTIAGVQRAAQWRCDFDPATQEVVIHSLAVRRGADVSEHAEPARLRFLQREENLERNVLDGVVSVVVLLENVRVGDVVDTSFSLRTKARVFPDNFALLTAVPLDHYTRLFQLSVRFPKGHGMRWQTDSQKISLNERDAGDGETEWSWRVENFAPRQPEPQMPSWHFHGRFIQITDFPSWNYVASGLAAAWEEKFDDPTLVKAASEIAAEPDTNRRVECALRLVQDDIRYLSVNTELGGQIPTEPGTVLQRRFGDCKDKVFLLVHLLRKLGVPARPILVHSLFQHRVDQFLPTAAVFNHAIIEYELAGKRHWVDATIPLQGGGPSGRSVPLFGKGLPVGRETTDLEPINRAPNSDGSYDLTETFRLESSSSPLHLYVTATATGSYADNLRQTLVYDRVATAKTRERFYERIYAKIRRHADLEWRDDRARNKIVLAEAYVMPELIASVHSPGVRGFGVLAHGIQGVLGFHDAEDRKHPLALPHPSNVRHRFKFEFEPLVPLASMRDNSSTAAFSFAVTGTQARDNGSVIFKVKTFADHVAPEDLDVHRSRVESIWPSTQLTILMSSGRQFGPLPDPAQSLLPSVEEDLDAVDDTDAEEQPAMTAAPDCVAPPLTSLPPDQQTQSSQAFASETSRSSKRSRRRSSARRRPKAWGIARLTFIGLIIMALIIKVILLFLTPPPK